MQPAQGHNMGCLQGQDWNLDHEEQSSLHLTFTGLAGWTAPTLSPSVT